MDCLRKQQRHYPWLHQYLLYKCRFLIIHRKKEMDLIERSSSRRLSSSPELRIWGHIKMLIRWG